MQKAGIKVKPEVMIPLVGFKKELDLQVEIVHRVAQQVMVEPKMKLNPLAGAAIEILRGPRRLRGRTEAEFFSDKRCEFAA